MERKMLKYLENWWKTDRLSSLRKPLVLRGARQVGKSYLVRDFAKRMGLQCLELNLEKEPKLRNFFVQGHNQKTIALLEAHFKQPIHENCLLFIDEIQTAPEIFSRLRYFFEDTPEVSVIAAGSLLEFALFEQEQSVPVGRVQYAFLGPMTFEEYLIAQNEVSLLNWIEHWDPREQKVDEGLQLFHDKLLSAVLDFSIIGGMPQVVSHFLSQRDFLGCQTIQRSLLETYQQDFSKYRHRIPDERLTRVFESIPLQISKKWVHARMNPREKAKAIEAALEALCRAQVAQKVFHSSGNGVPLAAEKKENLYKVLFVDVGLLGCQLGLEMMDWFKNTDVIGVAEGALAEQWIGQHLLQLGPIDRYPSVFYWVREKPGSMAEVDYLMPFGSKVYPIEIKAGSSLKAKSLQVFLSEKAASPFGIHFSTHLPFFDAKRKCLCLPFYMVGQLERIIKKLNQRI